MPLVGHLRESSAPAQNRIHSWRQKGGPNMRTMQLLQTKLQRPRVPRHYVPRPRLSERLDQGVQGPLTLVCANAGYGKTTLVSAWIEGLTMGRGGVTPPLPASHSLTSVLLPKPAAAEMRITPGARCRPACKRSIRRAR